MPPPLARVPPQIRPDAIVLGYPLLDPIVYRDEQLSDPRIDLRVPKTGGKTGRDLVMEYMEKVMGCEATDEALAAATPANVLDHRMPPTFVWGTSDDKTCPIVEVYDFAAALARAGVRHEVHVFDTRCTSSTRVTTASRWPTPTPGSITPTSRRRCALGLTSRAPSSSAWAWRRARRPARYTIG